MSNRRIKEIASEMAEHCMALRMRRVSRLITRAYDEALRGFGVTANQLNMLAAIAKIGEVRQVDLVGALDMEKSTVSRNMQRMHERGLVIEETGGAGRPYYSLSDDGEATLVAALPVWRRVQKETKFGVGAAAAAALEKLTGQ